MVQTLPAHRLARRESHCYAFSTLTFDDARGSRTEPIDAPPDVTLDPFDKLSGFGRQTRPPDVRVYVVQMIQHDAAWVIYRERAAHEFRIEPTHTTNLLGDCRIFSVIDGQSSLDRDPLPACLTCERSRVAGDTDGMTSDDHGHIIDVEGTQSSLRQEPGSGSVAAGCLGPIAALQ